MKYFLLVVLALPTWLSAQVTCGGATSFQILHFTRTEGFNHGTKTVSRTMFEEIGALQNFTVVNSDSESAFDDLAVLMGYEVIVFSNTTGNIPFTAAQKMNLENYVASGGAVLGIHGATDMYRDASYPFYTRLIGGSRRNSPPHTANNFPGTMDKIGTHPSTTNVPDPWMKNEEYYYWPDTGLVATIVTVLEVRSTGSNSYDDARPASWYQVFDSGARSFYTTLGHSGSNYTDPNNDFRKHVADALCWLVDAAPPVLPVTVRSTGLSVQDGIHQISWEIGGEWAYRVELYGGYTSEETALLKVLDQPNGTAGSLQHRPERPDEWFYYRLRFLDADGLPTWSEWLAAAPLQDIATRPQLRYQNDRAVLFQPAGGPTTAIIYDATGRMLTTINLQEGLNPLPTSRPGTYFIRFPFLPEGLKYIVR